MAIVEMKRAQMLALKDDEQALLKAIQKLGCFQVTPLNASETDFAMRKAVSELPETEELITRVGWALQKVGKYDKTKAPLLGGKPTITEEEAARTLERRGEWLEVVEALEALERENGELRGQTARIAALREQLSPWQSLPVALEEIHSTRNTIAMLGTMPKSAYELLAQQGGIGQLCCVELVSYLRDQACVYVVAHRSAWDAALQKLKEAGFAQVQFPVTEGTVQNKLDQLTAEQAHIDQRQEAIIGEIASHADVVPELKIYYDCLCSRRERLVTATRFATSASTFYLKGWVPAEATEKVEKRLRKASPTVCLEFSDPEEGDEPPVLLHNNPAVAPYETIVTGFALPSPAGLDPTAVMTPFFINFMGMMVSDAGYGLVMAIAIPLLIKFLKPSPGAKKLMWVIFGGGIMTILWGALYNTWFGFAPWPSIFDPVNNALPVMAVCVALGAVHLFTGLGVAAYMNIRRGHPLSAVADQLSWVLLLVGLGLMLVKPEIGQWIAIAGAGIILCTSGREKSKNPFKRLISGLGALYGITSWVSDLLSYMRLFGMGLATGVIGMVINQLVGMVFSSGVIGIVIGSVLFVGGHLFNMGINVLGAYVHSCRLQYIEFFGKFYEEGGKPFKPLTETNRYVYISEAPETL
ncbi:MAG: V-type ATP synthase subunit I [Clostridia bacterium]|nr:V-type ATP synthase subunit I [Clostridia bacterium]